MSKAILKTIEHKRLGKLRLILQCGGVWFSASDLCKALDIPSFGDALYKAEIKGNKRILVPRVEISVPSRPPLLLTLINQEDFDSLAEQSPSRKAQAFIRWVTREILPSLKTGDQT